MTLKNISLLVLVVSLLVPPGAAQARIKLITLPVRERVEVQMEHPDMTLVEEERMVPLVKGVNQVDFSWANTRVDPDTLVFRVMAPQGERPLEVKVLSVSYPPNEQALVWSVSASDSGAARVRIGYLLGGLDKSFNYRAVAQHDEKFLALSQYLRVDNNANESFDQASLWPGFGDAFVRAIGLDESIELLAARYPGVPVRKTYTADPAEFGYLDRAQDKLNVPMHYVLKNDSAHGLGQALLPKGKVRIFQDDGKGGTAFLGEDWGKLTPLEEEMRLSLGLARDIVVRRTIERNERTRRAGDLYDYDVVVSYQIENFKDTPAVLDLVEDVRHVRREIAADSPRDPQWELGAQHTLGPPDAEKSDAERLVFHVRLPARAATGKAEKVTQKLHLVLKNEWSSR